MLNMLPALALARFVFDLTFDFGTVLVLGIFLLTVGTIFLGIKNSGSEPEGPRARTQESTGTRPDPHPPAE
jgi:hypothetical protein